MPSLHSFARRLHGSAGGQSAVSAAAPRVTRGLILDQGWRYDLTVGFGDLVLFCGQLGEMRRRTLALANIQAGEQVLDAGCGTGTLALAAQRRSGATGRVVGIDPAPQQIARARAKAARRHQPIDFQLGMIEQLDFPDQSFDVVLSTLMMHHLPASLKRQGLVEIARVLKPGGRLVIADFVRRQERQGRAAHFHAGGSNPQDLDALVTAAGFARVTTQELRPARFSTFPGAWLLVARKA